MSPETNTPESQNSTAPASPSPSAVPSQPATAPAAVTSSTANNKNVMLAIVLVVVVLLVGGGVAAFALLSKKKSTDSAKTPSIETTTKSSTKSSVAARSVCMNNADYKEIQGWDVPDGVIYTADNPLTGNVHFKADSSEYEDATSFQDSMQQFADFAKKHPEKQFKYKLEGSVNEVNATAAGNKLATDRTNKVKTDLVKAGVPADLISVGIFEQKDNSLAATDNSGLDRAVVLALDPTCTASATTKQ